MSESEDIRTRERLDPCNLKISYYTYIRLRDEARAKKMSQSLYIQHLIDFYEMKCVGEIILKLKQMYLKGLNAVTLAHFSVLYSFLKEVDRQIGLD